MSRCQRRGAFSIFNRFLSHAVFVRRFSLLFLVHICTCSNYTITENGTVSVNPALSLTLPTIIVSDGIREKDRQNITGYLKQVSFMKDNTYHLHRHLWNDVSEDWQFYSEQVHMPLS